MKNNKLFLLITLSILSFGLISCDTTLQDVVDLTNEVNGTPANLTEGIWYTYSGPWSLYLTFKTDGTYEESKESSNGSMGQGGGVYTFVDNTIFCKGVSVSAYTDGEVNTNTDKEMTLDYHGTYLTERDYNFIYVKCVDGSSDKDPFLTDVEDVRHLHVFYDEPRLVWDGNEVAIRKYMTNLGWEEKEADGADQLAFTKRNCWMYYGLNPDNYYVLCNYINTGQIGDIEEKFEKKYTYLDFEDVDDVTIYGVSHDVALYYHNDIFINDFIWEEYDIDARTFTFSFCEPNRVPYLDTYIRQGRYEWPL